MCGIFFKMKIFLSDWPHLIRHHNYGFFRFCVLFSNIYPKIEFTAKNWLDLYIAYSIVNIFWPLFDQLIFNYFPHAFFNKRAKMALYRSPDYQISLSQLAFHSREEVQYWFSRWQPSWISNQNNFSYFLSTSCPNTSYQISSQWTFLFRRRSSK